jgi:hypothetical protein
MFEARVPTSQPEADHFAHDIWSRWFRLRSTTGKGFEITEVPVPERSRRGRAMTNDQGVAVLLMTS